MIPALRQSFNSHFSPATYQTFLQQLDTQCGTHVCFRNSETPCFFPRSLLEKMASYGKELIAQLLGSADYLSASDAAIPAEFNAPKESAHPLFVQVDFGLSRDASGALEPKLVELQGFPSLYAYQATLAQLYKRVYGLPDKLKFLCGDLCIDEYQQLMRRAILADHAPDNVILMEIEPLKQKTLPDFLLTERLCGIKTVCITEIIKEGSRLFYLNQGRRRPIHRIYNRAIADELIRKGRPLPFSFRDGLEVEWAGHPNWFFRISKFSLPYLRHACVPKTWLLHQLDSLPEDPEKYVLKPLYSFAGQGVIVGPTHEELAAIPLDRRSNYILQERVRFEPVIETPCGMTMAEVRVMYLWLDELTPVTTIVRMGRGKMMGVDHNRSMKWVGASVGFFE